VDSADHDPFDRPDLQDLAVTEFPRPAYKPWLTDITVPLQ
jgi:hypothetical protein